MKKVILAALALSLVMGIAAAQEIKIGEGELTFTGKLSTGIQATFDDAANEDGKVDIYSDTDDTDLRAELSALYTNGNTGFATRFRANDAFAANGHVIIPYAFAWVDLLDGRLRPVGGYINSNVWGTRGDLDKDITGAGLRLEIKPIEGLNFGAFLRVVEWGGDNQNQSPAIEQFLKSTALGFAYDTDAFYVRLQYLINANAHGATVTNSDKNGQLDFGIGFTGVPGLTANAEGRIGKLDDFSGEYGEGHGGAGDFRETIAYKISDALPLTIQLNVQELLYGGKLFNSELDPYVQINPSVSYALSDALTVGLGGSYGFGQKLDLTATSPAEMLTEYEHLIAVKPNLEFNFGHGLTSKLWYKFQTSKVKDVPDAVNANTIQLDFAYVF